MTEQPEPEAGPRAAEERVDVRGPDEPGACVQLAARWAEMFSTRESSEDHGASSLSRFRTTYAYIDAVIHGIEPPSPKP